jgi:hypothetical protein
MHSTPENPKRNATEADLEVLARVASVEDAAGAIMQGRWFPTPELLKAVGALVNSAEAWARRAA